MSSSSPRHARELGDGIELLHIFFLIPLTDDDLLSPSCSSAFGRPLHLGHLLREVGVVDGRRPVPCQC